MNQIKLKERCEILSKIIINLAEIYNDINISQDQKSFIETIIGAALWYLPSDKTLWTGEISEEALKKLNETKKINGLTKDHIYPRKMAARELLTDYLFKIKQSNTILMDLYINYYGKFVFVTGIENKRLIKHQKDKNFKNPYDAYNSSEIKLIKKTWNEIKPKKQSK